METEIHSVVELIEARMKSHPDEFTWEISSHLSSPALAGRWAREVNALLRVDNPSIKRLRKIMDESLMEAVHHKIMKRLVEGDPKPEDPSLTSNYIRQGSAQLGAQSMAAGGLVGSAGTLGLAQHQNSLANSLSAASQQHQRDLYNALQHMGQLAPPPPSAPDVSEKSFIKSGVRKLFGGDV
jgi:hypothetical protein